jgi:hypothetical protein
MVTNRTTSTYQEEAWQKRFPIPLEIYKGINGKYGVLRFKLVRPYTTQRQDKAKGYIELEAAPASGPNQYDWLNKKIKINLSYVDISKILLYLGSPRHSFFANTNGRCNIFHDRGISKGKEREQDTSSIDISKPQESKNFWFNITQTTDGEVNSKVSVGVGPDEVIILGNLLKAAIPQLFAWNLE